MARCISRDGVFTPCLGIFSPFLFSCKPLSLERFSNFSLSSSKAAVMLDPGLLRLSL